ncbi:MAG: carboxypeptidase regulatory-like domain-containing protein [bacterium]|nr:carboxypeptidase regulatory-like domain-containing protein [bacterium]
MMLWAADMFRNYTGIQDPSVATHNGSCNNTVIGEHLTEGVAFFLWRGTVVGEMNTAAASSMSSSPMLPVALTITCGSGDYNVDGGDCISESWLKAGTATSPKGGVCGIATATYNTHVPYNNTVAGGLVYNICNIGVRHIGTALSGAKVELLRSFPNDGVGAQFTLWNNLMGDPGISMWTEVPVVMNVTYPATVSVGTRRVRPQVVDAVTNEPIVDALVVLIKNGETFSKGFTDAGGFIDVPVTVNSTGTMTLTVSKRNHKPFLADIACVDAAEMVTVQSYTIDDDSTGGTFGNSNLQLNPGETVDLTVALRNFGTSGTATAISASMTCDNPDVTVVSGTSTYANLAPGQQANGASAFRVSLAPTMLHQESAKLTFEVSTSTGTAYSTVELTIQAGSATFVSAQVTGGNNNGRIDPGEVANLRITVRNDGALAMNDVSATLISRYSLLSINDGTGSFGNIPVNGTATSGATDLVIRANSVGYPGSMANLFVVLQTPSGFTDTVAFALPIGLAATSDPTGPDPYGYYAYDNIDTDYEFSRPYNWLNISPNNVGTRLIHASADPGEQLPSGQTNTDVVALPFSFTFYGQTYDTLTICSNGWAAFGDQGNLDMFRNYPIPGEQAAEAMLCPFWDDLKTNGTGDGVYFYYDEAENRFIVQWNAGGGYPQYNTGLDFQLVLLDPAHYPTNDGNGILQFMYDNAQSVPQDTWDESAKETIGISAPRALTGLQYRFGAVNAAGANGIGNDKCVTITTETRYATGVITGTITDLATGQPMSGVVISLDGEEDQAVTDVQGIYSMIDVEIGTYTVRARKFGYNDATTADFVVEMDSTEVASFSMAHPEITLSAEDMSFSAPGTPMEQSFDIENAGNGPWIFRFRCNIRRKASRPVTGRPSRT